MPPASVVSWQLLKRSVDARKKNAVHFVVNLRVQLADGALPRPQKGVQVALWKSRQPWSVAPASALRRRL